MSIVDPDTGLPRLLSRKCETCIFRPGNLMHLAEGAREHMVRTSLANGSWITCHETLPYGPHPDVGEAICRGFYDIHGHRSAGTRLARALGGPVEVDPPTTVKNEP